MDSDKSGKVEYNVRNVIGHGSFGCVYRGELKATGQTVAIKVVLKKEKEKGKEKYEREIEILESFKDLKHRHLVSLLDYADEETILFIIMEFCPSDFSKYLKHRKVDIANHLPESEIKNILLQLIEGYNVLYGAKVIHRDLKPNNILLCPTGNIPHPDKFENMVLKIADFGLSRFLDEEGNASTEAGNKTYRAPEVSSKSYDYKADLWSLGAMILECLIGRKELEGHIDGITRSFEFPFEPDDLFTSLMISEDLRDLLTSLLKRTPSNRIDFGQLLRHNFLSLSLESLEKLNEKRCLCSHSIARKEVSTLLAGAQPLPSTSGMNTLSPLAEGETHQKMQGLSDLPQGDPERLLNYLRLHGSIECTVLPKVKKTPENDSALALRANQVKKRSELKKYKPARRSVSLKIVIVGDTCVGKTSLLKQYEKKKFSHQCEGTIGANIAYKEILLEDVMVSMTGC